GPRLTSAGPGSRARALARAPGLRSRSRAPATGAPLAAALIRDSRRSAAELRFPRDQLEATPSERNHRREVVPARRDRRPHAFRLHHRDRQPGGLPRRDGYGRPLAPTFPNRLPRTPPTIIPPTEVSRLFVPHRQPDPNRRIVQPHEHRPIDRRPPHRV